MGANISLGAPSPIVTTSPRYEIEAQNNSEVLKENVSLQSDSPQAVSYTHLTLPTICSV